jgi:prepilin-type N-terminal cleavage/methylation domain-containing protein
MKVKGYSLVEILVVIAIIGIIGTIASFSWQRYVANSNLKTGARKVAADFAMYQARAIHEGRPYTIIINISPANNYDISAPVNALLPNPAPVNLPGVTPNEAARASDAQITAVDFNGGPAIIIAQRGLVQPLAPFPNDFGTITLTNSRNATATIRINLRGKVDVAFAGL